MLLSEKVIKAGNVLIVAKQIPQGKQGAGFGKAAGEGNCSTSNMATLSPESRRREEYEKNLAQVEQTAYEKGYSDGAAWQKKQSLPTLRALDGLLQEADALQKRLFAEAEGQMLDLVLAVAEKVIYEEVSGNNKVILTVLREAVKGVVERKGMKIHLNPNDYRYVTEIKPDLLLDLEGARNISFEADAMIKQGGALLETTTGEVDARLEQRVSEIKSALKRN